MKRQRFLWLHRGSLRYRLLTIPLYYTEDKEKAEKSRFSYGEYKNGYRLRVLGVLWGLFGLVVVLPEEEK